MRRLETNDRRSWCLYVEGIRCVGGLYGNERSQRCRRDLENARADVLRELWSAKGGRVLRSLWETEGLVIVIGEVDNNLGRKHEPWRSGTGAPWDVECGDAGDECGHEPR